MGLPTILTPLRLPPDLRQRLDDRKILTGQSINAMVIEILTEYFEREKVYANDQRNP